MTESSPRSRRLKALALLGGGVAAGAVIAGALTANAATTSGTPTTSTATSSGSSTGSATTPTTGSTGSTADRDNDGDGRHGGGGHNPDETTVTGAKATTLKAAALAKVPGGTVERIETDSGDAAYEVHMTKADGSEVTVKFDKNLAFVAIESGKGK